jgi:hypothetical protein
VAQANADVLVGSLLAVSAVGTVGTSADANVVLTGFGMTSAVGQVLVWGRIIPGQNPGYQPDIPVQSPTWVGIVPNQNPGYTPEQPMQSPAWSEETVSQSPGWTRTAA